MSLLQGLGHIQTTVAFPKREVTAVDRRKVEAYLLGVYKVGEQGCFEAQLLSKIKVGITLTSFFFIPLLGDALFDSWVHLVTLNFSENIDASLVVFILLLIPVCALVALLTARIKVSRMKKGASSHVVADLSGVGSSLGTVLVVSIVMSRGEADNIEIISAFHGLLFFIILCLFATVPLLYRLYLLRKYCPYLASYAGGDINRPEDGEG